MLGVLDVGVHPLCQRLCRQ